LRSPHEGAGWGSGSGTGSREIRPSPSKETCRLRQGNLPTEKVILTLRNKLKDDKSRRRCLRAEKRKNVTFLVIL
jgi:hypothetical protein